MCNFFSAIVTRDGRVLFCEEDSHETIIQRAGLRDDKLIDRDFVRIEIPNGDLAKYREDEIGTLPEWYNRDVVRDKCKEILTLIMPYRKLYEEDVMPLWNLYKDIVKAAQKLYEDIMKSAQKLYEESLKSAEEFCGDTIDSTLNFYDEAVKSAHELYKEKMALAWTSYDTVAISASYLWEKASAPFLSIYRDAISTVEGYIGGNT